MDVGDDRDVQLQRSATAHLAQLATALPLFLRHRAATAAASSPRWRTYVRTAVTTRLCGLLEPFQEWPQLLDPHLAALVQPLQDAVLQSCTKVVAEPPPKNRSAGLVEPLDAATCRLLYTLCKVRGPKVIGRFLDHEAANLELALRAFEAKLQQNSSTSKKGSSAGALTWEEKYVFMLWISILLLTPFDLDSLNFSKTAPEQVPTVGLQLSRSLPTLATRLIDVAMLHLYTAGKEREAAVKTLSRLAARPDMISCGVHDSFLQYILSNLRGARRGSGNTTPYGLIGSLALLAGLLSTLDLDRLKPYISSLFIELLEIATEGSQGISAAAVTAVSRKLIVKNVRILSVSALQLTQQSESGVPESLDTVLEDSIDYLLNILSDTDTLVRQAASKSISLIVSKLPSQMAAEVVEAVTGSLDENVLWFDDKDVLTLGLQSSRLDPRRSAGRRDLSAVNPLRWHGLILSLSQLLFQRSAPASQLSNIISCLILALGFEQKAPSGNAVGSNVRDAANFGIWSLARKYSTSDLSSVEMTTVRALKAEAHLTTMSIIQSLAIELIVSSTLDPTGNIRRGSSAALQELIGRHPDVVLEGIPLVQVVDYHAVALRSKAFSEVAIDAARLNKLYWSSILVGMMGWRGLEAGDASSRRLAAESVGLLCHVSGQSGAHYAARQILERLTSQKKNIERRHGLVLAASAVIAVMERAPEACDIVKEFWCLLQSGMLFDAADLTSSTRRPELTAEAVSRLIRALAAFASTTNSAGQRPDSELMNTCMRYLSMNMERREPLVVLETAQAAEQMFKILSSTSKTSFVHAWIAQVDSRLSAHDTGKSRGHVTALGYVFNCLDSRSENLERSEIVDVLLRVLGAGFRNDIDARVSALSALGKGVYRTVGPIDERVLNALKVSLQDYTVDERGDIGSLVRLEAISLARHFLRSPTFAQSSEGKQCISIVVILAGEKLDRVRFVAWTCLQDLWLTLNAGMRPDASFQTTAETSATAYFSQITRLLYVDWLSRPAMQGLCISAGSGSESVLRAARSALEQHFARLSNAETTNRVILLLALCRDNLDQDRIIVPLIETWAFLLQSGVIDNISACQDFTFRRLFAVIQKAHYKSGNPHKLTAAVQLYSSLASRDEIREDVLKKLISMLLHPLPRVRNAAADALYLAVPIRVMAEVNWSNTPRDLKDVVDTIKAEVIAH